TIAAAITIQAFRLLGLVSSRVEPDAGATGKTVVGAVPRLIAASVVCGRMLVSISVDTVPEPNFAVPASPLNEPESLMSAVPSARQKPSASSVSTRLHCGQRFIRSKLSNLHNL